MKKKLILLSGGIGSRTGLDYPKQYHSINGVSLINFLLGNVFNLFSEIVVVIDKQYKSEIDPKFKVNFAENGNTRIESLKNGLIKLKKDADIIFIHEAARPLLDSKDIDAHISAHDNFDAVVTVEKSIDTMFRINNDGIIIETIPKSEIVKGYNPQSYKGNVINDNMSTILSTMEDKDLLEILNVKTKTIQGINDLRKVTTTYDIEWIENEMS